MTVKQRPASAAFRAPLSVQLREGAAAVRYLMRRLSGPDALRVLARATAHVGPTRTRARQAATPPLCRSLDAVESSIAWAITIYQALRREPRVGQYAALELTNGLVLQAGMHLMQRAFPQLDGPNPLAELQDFVLPALGFAERHGLYRVGPAQRTTNELRFDIRYCHYAATCNALEVPELAHAFCEVDRPFFSELCPELRFECPQRIASGAAACTFIFRTARLPD